MAEFAGDKATCAITCGKAAARAGLIAAAPFTGGVTGAIAVGLGAVLCANGVAGPANELFGVTKALCPDGPDRRRRRRDLRRDDVAVDVDVDAAKDYVPGLDDATNRLRRLVDRRPPDAVARNVSEIRASYEYLESSLLFEVLIELWGKLFFESAVFVSVAVANGGGVGGGDSKFGISEEAKAWIGFEDDGWIDAIASATDADSDGGVRITGGEVAALNLSRPLRRPGADGGDVPVWRVEQSIARFNASASAVSIASPLTLASSSYASVSGAEQNRRPPNATSDGGGEGGGGGNAYANRIPSIIFDLTEWDEAIALFAEVAFNGAAYYGEANSSTSASIAGRFTTANVLIASVAKQALAAEQTARDALELAALLSGSANVRSQKQRQSSTAAGVIVIGLLVLLGAGVAVQAKRRRSENQKLRSPLATHKHGSSSSSSSNASVSGGGALRAAVAATTVYAIPCENCDDTNSTDGMAMVKARTLPSNSKSTRLSTRPASTASPPSRPSVAEAYVSARLQTISLDEHHQNADRGRNNASENVPATNCNAVVQPQLQGIRAVALIRVANAVRGAHNNGKSQNLNEAAAPETSQTTYAIPMEMLTAVNSIDSGSTPTSAGNGRGGAVSKSTELNTVHSMATSPLQLAARRSADSTDATHLQSSSI